MGAVPSLEDDRLRSLKARGDSASFWIDSSTPLRPDPDMGLIVDTVIDHLDNSAGGTPDDGNDSPAPGN
jgi:hypothetical protein